MKKFLFYFVLLSSIFMNAQTIIVEEKFVEDNVPLDYSFLNNSNELVIQKGKHVKMSLKREVHSLNKYEYNSTKSILIDNSVLMDVSFSDLDNSIFLASDYAAMKWSSDYKIYSEGKPSSTIKKKQNYDVFDKEYLYLLADKNEDAKINFDKEDLFLYKINAKTQNKEKILISEPIINQIVKDDYYDLKKIYFKSFFRKDYFELVTKLISKDCNTSTLYRFLYDYNGKKIKSYTYKIFIDNPFIRTNNGGGNLSYTTFQNSSNVIVGFIDQLTINNFYIDELTQDIYVYGLYGKKDKKNINSNPTGYYVFKFNQKGDLIWKQLSDINDKQLNGFGNEGNLYTSLEINKSNVNFIIYSEKFDEFVFYKQLNAEKGNVKNENKITYKEDKVFTMMSGTRDFILSFYEINKTKVRFDALGLVYYDCNKSFKSYIDSINSSKDKIYMNTLVSKEGIWLIETDNKNYYKVTYFNHE